VPGGVRELHNENLHDLLFTYRISETCFLININTLQKVALLYYINLGRSSIDTLNNQNRMRTKEV
jgi:hypothetical protein